MEATETKRVIIIAGANGAGKTTFARSYLPNEALCIRFVNVDMIASGLSPFAPEIASVKAGRLALQEMDERVECGESFAFETTLSRTGYLKRIKRWRSLGYKIAIHYLFLPSVDIAIARVSERVKHGGHNIPEAVIRRRFTAGLRNFDLNYRANADFWATYDNGGEKPKLLDWGTNEIRI